VKKGEIKDKSINQRVSTPSENLNCLYSYFSHVKRVPVTTAWRVLRLRTEERPPIWRVAANILNKQLWTATRCGAPAWGSGEVLTTLPVKTHVK
jgi:hypothetical protein